MRVIQAVADSPGDDVNVILSVMRPGADHPPPPGDSDEKITDDDYDDDDDSSRRIGSFLSERHSSWTALHATPLTTLTHVLLVWLPLNI